MTILIEPDGDRFHAHSQDAPGLHTDGQTIEAAGRAFLDALAAYRASFERHGEAVPAALKRRSNQLLD
jgi:predicted RNase H-like HicB family nuclease